MAVTLYVIKGRKSARRYLGITNDLQRGLREHSSRTTKAAQLLGDFILIHTEELPDYRSARIREKFLKSGQGRRWLDKVAQRTGLARGE